MPNAAIFGADELARWPEGALDLFAQELRILKQTAPSREVRCDQCERGCSIRPEVRTNPQTGEPADWFCCSDPEKEIGGFWLAPSCRTRWKVDMAGLANVVSKAVGTVGEVTIPSRGRLAFLGTAKVDGKTREVFLAIGAAWPDATQVFGKCLRLKMASHPAVLTLAAMPKEPLLDGCELAVRPLAEIARFEKGRLKVSLDGAFPEVEPGPWADLPNEPVTLVDFMGKFCEGRSLRNRRSRRDALTGADRNDTVKMPSLAVPYQNGSSNKYFTHDLLKAWQGFLDENLDLPPLLPIFGGGDGA